MDNTTLLIVVIVLILLLGGGRMVWAGTLVLVHSIASDDEAVPSFSIATVHSSLWNPCVNGEFPDQCLKQMPRPPRHPSES